MDKVCDFIPVVSTLSNLVNLFQKAIFNIPSVKESNWAKNKYFKHISKKGNFRTLMHIMPGMSNCLHFLHEMQKLTYNTAVEALEKGHIKMAADQTLYLAEDLILDPKIRERAYILVEKVINVLTEVGLSIAKNKGFKTNLEYTEGYANLIIAEELKNHALYDIAIRYIEKGDLGNAERIAKQMTRKTPQNDQMSRKSGELKNQAIYDIAIRYIEKGDFQKVKDLNLFNYKDNYIFFRKRQSGPKNNEFYRDIASRLISLNQLQLAKDIANKIDDEKLKHQVISQTNQL